MLFSELISKLKKRPGNLLDYDLKTNPEIITGASLEKGNKNQISFLEKSNSLSKYIQTTRSSAILIPNEKHYIDIAKESDFAYAILNDPKLGFAEVLQSLCPEKIKNIGIHKTSVIGEGVTLGKDITISSHVSIGDNCSIGDECIIHAGVVIYDDVVIHNKTIIHANSVIHRRTLIHNECVINPNAVIGSEGFGFVPTKEGWVKMPQTGIVVLGPKVEIGAGSTIDRPAVGETRIGEGTKIDNLVHIGHGVITGKGCAMAAQVGIAGGVILGDSVILAGQVGITNKVRVGDGVVASSKCGIHTDIEPGNVISGFPAIPNKLWLRCSANFKKLPELVKAIRELDRKSSR